MLISTKIPLKSSNSEQQPSISVDSTQFDYLLSISQLELASRADDYAKDHDLYTGKKTSERALLLEQIEQQMIDFENHQDHSTETFVFTLNIESIMSPIVLKPVGRETRRRRIYELVGCRLPTADC